MSAIDPILIAPPPSFSEEDAARLARVLFGVEGAARGVDSERDQTFLIDGDHATVLKISNAAASRTQLDWAFLEVTDPWDAEHLIRADFSDAVTVAG